MSDEREHLRGWLRTFPDLGAEFLELGATPETTSMTRPTVAATDTGFDAAAKPQTNLCRYFNENVLDHLVSLESDASVLLNTYGYTKETCFLTIWGYE